MCGVGVVPLGDSVYQPSWHDSKPVLRPGSDGETGRASPTSVIIGSLLGFTGHCSGDCLPGVEPWVATYNLCTVILIPSL